MVVRLVERARRIRRHRRPAERCGRCGEVRQTGAGVPPSALIRRRADDDRHRYRLGYTAGAFMRKLALFALTASLVPAAAPAQTALAGAEIHIARATGPIKIDGDLSDEAWKTATRIDKWYETQPGDNVEPKVGDRKSTRLRSRRAAATSRPRTHAS